MVVNSKSVVDDLWIGFGSCQHRFQNCFDLMLEVVVDMCTIVFRVYSFCVRICDSYC